MLHFVLDLFGLLQMCYFEATGLASLAAAGGRAAAKLASLCAASRRCDATLLCNQVFVVSSF